ncbi:MAG TPA: ribbon-helix-helix domain-containing protein [Nonomuraea sp.]|nr:ribbon-helix-helix domain-containing protein [Nonomuraea sp.]
MVKTVTSVRLSEEQTRALDEIGEREERSRSWLISKAVDEFIARRRQAAEFQMNGVNRSELICRLLQPLLQWTPGNDSGSPFRSRNSLVNLCAAERTRTPDLLIRSQVKIIHGRPPPSEEPAQRPLQRDLVP